MCHRVLQHSGGDAFPLRQGQRQKGLQLSCLESESRFERNPAFLPTVSIRPHLQRTTYHIVLQTEKHTATLNQTLF